MKTLRLALDWTPNTNHTGFFVAQELGFYTAAGLDVRLLSPATDDYATTPAKKLELGEVDFAVAPFESVISLNTKPARVRAVAIAALLQQDISSIATLTASGIARPRDLDGRTYASYRARYEDAIVRQLVINDGGTGDFTVTYPDKLGIWNTLLTGAADATWIFDNWEGVEAHTQGVALRTFALADYGIPYGYSPVVMATAQGIEAHRAEYTAFVQATRQGFQFALSNLQEATDILRPHVPARDARLIDLATSQAAAAAAYGEASTWGTMEASRVDAFLDWLIAHGLETAAVRSLPLFTNSLLQ
ncbi:ABC transporter substrate-binding protein [Hymenobacter agri]